MWLLEDYYMSQQGSTKIDCSKGVERNDMTGGVQKGIYRACTRNGVDPASIRGLLEYIPPAKDRPHTDEEYLEALRENS